MVSVGYTIIPPLINSLCASAIASSSILLQSKSDRYPNGLGNDCGELGHNIMDHQLGSVASGKYEGFEDKNEYGNRPNGFYIPRFRKRKLKFSDCVQAWRLIKPTLTRDRRISMRSVNELLRPRPSAMQIRNQAVCL